LSSRNQYSFVASASKTKSTPNQISPALQFPEKVSLDCESLGVSVGLAEMASDGLYDGEVVGAVEGLAEGE
jgi:hypothetical protein